MRKILLGCFFSFLISQVYCQRVASVSGLWSSTTTWGGAAVPTAADIVQINSNITVTVDVNAQCLNLNFLGTDASNPGIVQLTGSTAITLAVNGNINMAGANQAGRVVSINADHLINVSGNITASTGGGTNSFQMTTGRLRVINTGTSNLSMSATSNLNYLEIGDGTNTKIANFTGAGPVRFAANGRLIVTNAAIFNAQSAAATVLNSGGSASASLIVRNGGAFYSHNATTATAATSDVLANFTTVNSGEADANITTGVIQFTPPTATAATFSIPSGTYGNLYFRRVGAATGTTATTVDVVGSASAVTVKIVGDFNAYSAAGVTGTTTSGNYLFRGSSTAANRANVTWQFSGTGKSIVIDRTGRAIFGSTTFGSDASTESKVIMSGTITLDIFSNTASGTGTAGRLWIHDWTIADGAGFSLKSGIVSPATTTSAYEVRALGNFTIGPTSNAAVDLATGLTGQQILFYADETRTTSSTWSGNGSLLARSFKTSVGNVVINSSLNSITIDIGGLTSTQINSAPVSGSLFASGSFTFNQTSGSFVISNSTAPADWTPVGGGSTTNVRLNNLTVKLNTQIDFSYAFNTIQLNGNIVFENGAGWQTNNSATGGAVIEFAGTTPQTLTAGTGSVQFNRMRMNNSSGLTINGTINIVRGGSIGESYLDLTAGNITTSSANELIIWPNHNDAASNNPFVNGSASSFIKGPVRVMIQRTVGGLTKTFLNPVIPVGKGSRFGRVALAGITGQVDNDYFDAEYFVSDHSSVNANVTDPHDYTTSLSGVMIYTSYKEHWSLTKNSGSNMQAKVSLYYESNLYSEIGDKGHSKLRVAILNGSNQWQDMGNDNVSATQASGSSGSINSSAIFGAASPDNIFGYITFGTTDKTANLLPSKIISFKAVKHNSYHSLEFAIGCAADYADFELQRSADGKTFTSINNFRASQERCNQPFSIDDQNILAYKNYYRLKMTDANGAIIYSTIELISYRNKNVEVIGLMPNVTSSNTMLNVAVQKAAKIFVTILAADGRILMQKEYNVMPGTNRLPVDVSALSAGTYFLKCTAADLSTVSLAFLKQ
jgi:hypothetical protein